MPGGRRAPIDRALREYARVRRHLGPGRDISFDQAIHVAQRLSRRDFLRLGGLAGAGAVLAGAGLAGITAAYRLHQAGIVPQVFEARDRVGGRCWSSRDWAGGQVAEHGGEFIDTRHVHLRVLIEELGLELDDLWSAWVPGSTGSSSWRRPGRSGRSGRAPCRRRSWRSTTCRPPIGIRARSVLARPEVLGAGNLIDYYAIDYTGGDERYTVRGGNDQVPARILEELPEGTVTFGTALESLRAAGDGRLELEFDGVAGQVVADRVILAVPFTTLRQVDLGDAGFSDEMRAAVDELGMGTNAKVLLQFDRPFYTGFGDWSGGLNRGDDPILGTWESGSTDGAERLGLLTVYSGGDVGASYGVDESLRPQGTMTSRRRWRRSSRPCRA